MMVAGDWRLRRFRWGFGRQVHERGLAGCRVCGGAAKGERLTDAGHQPPQVPGTAGLLRGPHPHTVMEGVRDWMAGLATPVTVS